MSVLRVERAREVVEVARRERVTTAAASLAFHAFNALIPFALFVVVGLSLSGELGLVLTAVGSAAGVGTAAVERVVRLVTNTTTGRTQAAGIALVVLVWSAGRMLHAANETFEAVYGTRRDGSWLGTLRDVLIVSVTVALALGGLAVVGLALSFVVRNAGAVVYLAPVALFVLLTAGFTPMYYVFPGVDVTLREALPGALFAAGAWTLSSVGFLLYASVSKSVHLYGVVGGVMLLLTWLYVGGLVLLVGVVINAVLADKVDAETDD